MTVGTKFQPIYDEETKTWYVDGCHTNNTPLDEGKKFGRFVIAVSVTPPVINTHHCYFN